MHGLAGKSLRLVPGLPGQAFSVAFTTGRDVASGCLPKRWAVAIAARRMLAVAIILPSVSTRRSR